MTWQELAVGVVAWITNAFLYGGPSYYWCLLIAAATAWIGASIYLRSSR